MFATHSAPAPDPARQLEPTLAAIVYANDEYPDALFKWIVNECRLRRLTLSGVLQHPAFEGADRRCDVLLEDLASGHRTLLFENRGEGARGCRLDVAALVEASMRVESSLQNDPDLLVLNKFGKVECDGGGMCSLMAQALERGIPAIIGVPARNLNAWRDFAGEFSVEFSEDTDQIAKWLAKLEDKSLCGAG
jgi:hypothetical protein